MEKFYDCRIKMNFLRYAEQDFFLHAIGYNDFHYIAPLKTFHIQKMYTLHFVLSGSGILEIYGRKFKIKPYDMFFIPPNQNMRYYPEVGDPWTYIWVEFSGERSAVYQNKMGFSESLPVKSSENCQDTINFITSIFNLPTGTDTVGYYSALALFYKLTDTAHNIETTSSKRLKDQISAYINCHFHDRALKIEDICKDFNISHPYLCKLFKDGKSAKEMLTEKRISEAKKLLKTTNLTIGEVGYSVGYTDQAHFMKIFKKYCGIPAGEYRKQNI